MLSCYLYIFLGKVSFKVFCSFLNWVVFLLLRFKCSLDILANSLLSDAFFCKYFSPVCGLSSHSLDPVLQRVDIFNFNEVHLINYFFLVIYYLFIYFIFLTSLLEYNCYTMVCQFLLYNKMNQLYIYICPPISSLLHLPPSHPPYPTPLGGHKAPS